MRRTVERDVELTVGVIAAGLVILGGLVALGVRALVDTLRHRHRPT